MALVAMCLMVSEDELQHASSRSKRVWRRNMVSDVERSGPAEAHLFSTYLQDLIADVPAPRLLSASPIAIGSWPRLSMITNDLPQTRRMLPGWEELTGACVVSCGNSSLPA